MVAQSKQHEIRERLAHLHDAQARMRSTAFVDYAPIVCGLALRPMTHRTYRQLQGFQNSFVTGGAADLKAIFQFVWVHHPEFDQFAFAARRRVFRAVWRALHPRLPTFNAVIVYLRPIAHGQSRRGGRIHWRALAWLCDRCVRPTQPERLHEAATEIRRLVHEALHDFPASGDDSPSLPYAQYPMLVGLLQRAHQMSFAEARALIDGEPLRQLVEWIREAIHRLSHGKEKLMSVEEAAIWAEWMDTKQAEVDGARRMAESN